MATYFVASGGSNTAPYDTWAKAGTSLATVLAAASTAGDVVVIQYNAVPSTDAELAADTTYTLANDVSVVSASNDGTSAYTLTAMGTGAWIGNSTTSRLVRFAGSDRRCLMWGLTLRTASSTAKAIAFANTTYGFTITVENCYLWGGNTAATFAAIESGVGGSGVITFRDCTFRFGATSQWFQASAGTRMEACTVTSAGSIPTTFFAGSSTNQIECHMSGCDFTQITETLVGNMQTRQVWFVERCIFGSGMTVLATQSTNPNLDSASVWMSDCLIGTGRINGYYDALGSAIREPAIYYTGGAAGSESWKIVTTANVSYRLPFRTPWVDWYNTGTSAITPRFEILRDGSTTAYKDNEIWAEFGFKNTASSPIASGFARDRMTLANLLAGTAGTDQAAGAGLGSWTGESGTAWSGKVDSGSSITPTESGYLRGRIAVAAASITVYVDPVIRTA